MISVFDKKGRFVPCEMMNFPEGESFVKMKISPESEVDILWKYENDQELFVLGLIFDVIHHNKGRVENLYIPYFPHARQDRNTSHDQPFSLNVFVGCLKKIIGCDLAKIKIHSLDVHSDVLSLLMNNNDYLVWLSNPELFKSLDSCELTQYFDFRHINCIICPDKGAKTRSRQWAEKLELPILYCEKTRDPNTGRLSNPVVVNEENLRNDWTYLLVDDIGTGFGTHIQLANFIKSKRTPQGLPDDASTGIEIFVVHAGFSNGIEPVLDVFDRIYTTDSLIKGNNKIKDLQKQNNPSDWGCLFVAEVEKVFGLPKKNS
jgi:ribose-phosphate pyrophosphokinase